MCSREEKRKRPGTGYCSRPISGYKGINLRDSLCSITINLEIAKKTIFLKIWTISLLCKRFIKSKLDYSGGRYQI